MKYKLFKIGIAFLLGVYVLSLLFYQPSPSDQDTLENNQNLASPIIQAINEYENFNRRPPSDLEALVPTFLATVPETAAGEEFQYLQRDMYSDWTLTFRIRWSSTGCTYISHFDFWDCWPPGIGEH